MPDNKPVPVPVQLALEALEILEAEDAALAEQWQKKLPGFALRLAAAGEEVTVEGLLASARAKEIDKIPEPKQRTKTYAEIVAQLPVPDSGTELIRAIRAGDVDALRQLVADGVDIPVEMRDVMRKVSTVAGQQGDLNVLEFLIEQGASIESLMVDVAENGHLDIVKYFVEERGWDPRRRETHSSGTFAAAARSGSMELVKYLARTCGANDRYALAYATLEGHLDIVKYVVEQGTPVSTPREDTLKQAVEGGYFDIARYLIEKGADPHACGERALAVAAREGYLDIVKYLVKDQKANVHVKGQYFDLETALYHAAHEGHLDVVKFLMEEQQAQQHPSVQEVQAALETAAHNSMFNITQYLIGKGADVTAISWERAEDKQRYDENFAKYLVASERWQKTAHIDAPIRLYEANPEYFKPKAFDAVRDMLRQEEDRVSFESMAFHAAGLFGTEDRVLQYLEKWGKAGKQPLHDIIQMIKLPENKTPEMDLKAWGDAVLKCGPSMARLVKFADRLPAPEKSDDGQTWSMKKTRDKVAEFAFERAKENPVLAALCMEHNVDEEDFDKALKLSKKPPVTKNIPKITIDGEEFGLPGATFRRLDKDDIRGLFLGEMTDCCQSIGGVGAKCAEHGFTSENSGFYVVENAKGRVIGQTWAWRGKKGELVFDSLETLGQNVKPEQWQKLTGVFAKALANKPGDVTALHIGKGGATPRSLSKVFNEAASPAKPIGYNDYRDSKSQVVVWRKQGELNG